MTIENGILNLSGAIQMRGGTSEALSSENPVLARREIAVEVDTGKLKVGDGVHGWNELPGLGSETWTFELEDGSTETRSMAKWI